VIGMLVAEKSQTFRRIIGLTLSHLARNWQRNTYIPLGYAKGAMLIEKCNGRHYEYQPLHTHFSTVTPGDNIRPLDTKNAPRDPFEYPIVVAENIDWNSMKWFVYRRIGPVDTS